MTTKTTKLSNSIMKKITEVLDAIPGAFERHQQGQSDAREGRIAEKIAEKITEDDNKKELKEVVEMDKHERAKKILSHLESIVPGGWDETVEIVAHALGVLEAAEGVEEWMVEWAEHMAEWGEGMEERDTARRTAATLQRILDAKGGG